MLIADFEKLEIRRFTHLVFKAMIEFVESKEFSDYEDPEGFINLIFDKHVKPLAAKDLSEEQLKKLKEVSEIFFITAKQSFPPLCAFMGGIVA